MSQEKQSKDTINIEEQNQSAAADVSAAGSDNQPTDTSQQKKSEKKSAFEVYCDENPEAVECRIYED